MTDLQMGKVQLRIMRFLWDKKKAAAREITEALDTIEPIAHSTVQTLLRILEQKGVVRHSVENRTFIFYPTVKDEKVINNATNDFLDRVFSGSASSLVSYLVKNSYISTGELEEISGMLNKKE
jgi:BlaI family transcriptional regulator, penicillinase repressor